MRVHSVCGQWLHVKYSDFVHTLPGKAAVVEERVDERACVVAWARMHSHVCRL